MLASWWNELMLLQQIFLLFAIPSSVILVIQTILLVIGMNSDGADGLDLDGDGVADAELSPDDGLSLFTVRGIMSMLCVMGWAGFALLGTDLHPAAAVAIALALGVATLVGMAYLMRALGRLQSSGNLDVANAIGKVGQVYIPIPGGASAAGKVTLTIQDRFSEFSAITTESETIATGAYVRVVAVDDAGTLVVERVAAPEKKED